MFSIDLDDGTDEPSDCANMTCPIDYFKCPMSGKCIPNENVCDNFDDCLSIDKISGISADETSQSCSKKSIFSCGFSVCVYDFRFRLYSNSTKRIDYCTDLDHL